jgi:hypothetical protein
MACRDEPKRSSQFDRARSSQPTFSSASAASTPVWRHQSRNSTESPTIRITCSFGFLCLRVGGGLGDFHHHHEALRFATPASLLRHMLEHLMKRAPDCQEVGAPYFSLPTWGYSTEPIMVRNRSQRLKVRTMTSTNRVRISISRLTISAADTQLADPLPVVWTVGIPT